MAIIGQMLLWLGFLGGSLACVMRLENEDDKWSTIPWGIYAAGTAIGIAGVVLLRLDKASKRSASAESESDFQTVHSSLSNVAARISSLCDNLENMTCEGVLEYIDQECVPQCAEFVEGRQVLVNRFGTAVFASVMTEFASGERYMNRAWSASADGYVDEVKKSLGYANDFYAAAVKELEQAIASKQ